MRQAITAIGVAALLALGACGNKKDSPAAAGSGSAMAAGSGSAMAAGSGSAPAAGSGSAMAAGSAAAGSGSAMAAGSGSAPAVAVPTEEDFENNATAKITDKNVEAQVQALEKELEAK
jgi:hypothetical protein